MRRRSAELTPSVLVASSCDDAIGSYSELREWNDDETASESALSASGFRRIARLAV